MTEKRIKTDSFKMGGKRYCLVIMWCILGKKNKYQKKRKKKGIMGKKKVLQDEKKKI